MFLSAWLKSNIKIITVKNEGSLFIMKNSERAGMLFTLQEKRINVKVNDTV